MGVNVFASAVNWESVTPSDAELVNCCALHIGVGGDVAIAHETGAATVFKNLANGSVLAVELRAGRVMATGTTATDVVALTW